jgi:L-asparaginase
MIVILFTGGTITMRNDPGGGGAQPGLTATEILNATKGIRAITAVETEEWGQFPGPHMTVDRMWALRNRIVEHLARPEVTGVVITHGTDTLEESAYLVARSTSSDKPIVFTGAMRTVSDLGWDGPANLFEAVRVAASPETRGFGVMVVIGGQIFAALDTTKTNTHLLDAFESPGLGPLGVLDEGELILRREMPPSPPIIEPKALATPIDIIFAAAGSDARLLDASRESRADSCSRRWDAATFRRRWCPGFNAGWPRENPWSLHRARRADASATLTDIRVEVAVSRRWAPSLVGHGAPSRPA